MRPATPFLRLFSSSRMWLGSAVLLSILICGTVAWLGFRHDTEHGQVMSRLESIRLARVELSRGFVIVALGGVADSPFDRNEGLALLGQAIATIEGDLVGLRVTDEETREAFRQSVRSFRGLLAGWKATDFSQPGKAAEVRIAFRQVDRLADQVDTLTRESLKRFSDGFDRQFKWAIVVAALLLAGICLVVFRAIRAANASDRELRANEERFREISSTFTDIAYSCTRQPDGSHTMDWMTGRVELVLGYSLERIRALGGWSELVLEEDRPLFREHVTGLAPGADGTCDLRLRTLDGGLVWMASYCRCMASPSDGGVVRLFGALVNITERKLGEERTRAAQIETRQLLESADSSRRALLSVVEDQKRAEAALAESLERYQLANRATFDVLWDWNFQTGAVVRNPNFQTVFGYGPGSVEPGIESWNRRIHPEDHDRVQAGLHAALESTVDFWSDHYRFLCRDGHYAEIEDRGYISRDAAGKPVRMIGAMLDITERRRSEEELRRLSMAVEQSSAIVVITDRNGKIEYVNPRFTRVTGFTPDEVRGRSPGFLKSGSTSPEEYTSLWETINAGLEWHGEFQNRKKDGTLYWEQATISPMRDPSGVITHFIGVKEDITAHKALESQFLQAQKMETVGRLAGGVAHDFNNMLQVISSYTEMAMMKTDSALPLYQYLLQIREAARRSADLTRQLLAFARKQTVSPQVLDLNETVSGMLKMLRRLIGEDIDLAWMPGLELWKVRIDPSQVDQMLANLAVNSRDAIAGAGKLTIETRNIVCDEAYCARHAGSVPGEYVLLTVSDNGCGMSEQTMSHLFEPFFTTKGVGKGTGLGTATVYGIVRQNNGFINVQSQPGVGTSFRIYLPRLMEEAGQTQVQAEQPAPPRGTETVLFVEDEAAILAMGRHMLEELGYTVLTAGSPREALRLAGERGGEIHLLITDVVMPEMNGREMAEKIIATRPGLRCMYMSGYTADVIAHQGVLNEGVRFIQKPFFIQELARKVRDALDQP